MPSAWAEDLAGLIYRRLLAGPGARRWAHRAILRLIPSAITVGPARLLLNPQDPVISCALTLGVYESREIAFFNQFIRRSHCFVDVGANVGLYTALALRQMARPCKIVALEPHPRTFHYLQRNIESNRAGPAADAASVLALNVAAGSAEGIGTLHCNSENGGDHRLSPPSPEDQRPIWSTQSVQVLPLDGVLGDHAIRQVDFIKMDVQGHEHEVLRGLAQTLKRSPRVILMTEFWPAGLAATGGGLALLKLLKELGFQVCRLKADRREWLEPITDPDALLAALPGDRYTTIVALKGWAVADFGSSRPPRVPG